MTTGLLVAFGLGPPARAQIPAYSASQLHCTRWSETSSSEIETVTAGRSSEGRAGRDGRWNFRARDTTGGIALEAWYDSLAVWRRADGTELVPDTDGVIGGRFGGVLQPGGAYTARRRPFVPDDIAEVAEIGGALDDLFPPLPQQRLAQGQRWRVAETEIRRVADTIVAGRPLWRFTVRTQRTRTETVARGDTIPIPVRQTTTEEGEFAWNPASGLAWRSRDIVVETSISAQGRIRQPVRSRLTQHVELTRLPVSACH